MSVDFLDRIRVCGLDTDLKLNQPRAHLSDKFQFLLIEDIRGDLEMEVCDPIVMFHEITPDS